MPSFPLIHAPVHYSHGRRSAPLISRLRAEAVSPPIPFPSSSPSVLFAIPLPHRRGATCYLPYPITSDVSPPPFISRRHVYPVFAVLFHRYLPLLRAVHRFISLLPSSRFSFRFCFTECSLSLSASDSRRPSSLLLLFVFCHLLFFAIIRLSSISRRFSLTFYASFPPKVSVWRFLLFFVQSSCMPLSFCVPHLGVLCI